MKWYYVYEIVYKDFMRYLGYRSCYGHPLEDDYFGSGSQQPDDSEILFKTVLYITRDEAKAYEAETWHLEYVDARNNPQYYNCCNNGWGFRSSEQAKAMWADPDSAYNSEEVRQKMSESAKAMWADEEFRQKRSEISKALWSDPDSTYNSEEFRQKCSESMKAMWEDEEYRQKRSESVKAMWEDEEFRQKMSKARTDHNIHHFYNYETEQSVFGKQKYLKANAKHLFGFSKGSVVELKMGRRRSIQGWLYLGTV